MSFPILGANIESIEIISTSFCNSCKALSSVPFVKYKRKTGIFVCGWFLVRLAVKEFKNRDLKHGGWRCRMGGAAAAAAATLCLNKEV